ncbi:MAG: sigma-70 family RNA polymerase sigma factor [Planctomycetes bacterium]|nr:sigma-70 family RNA polymerase sigma factor [Planctomycetota bacterium]
MSRHELDVTPDELLATNRWLRALALRLTDDEQHADDAVQETWLRALRTPPSSSGSFRGWLATVLKSRLHSSAIAQERRRRHESRVHHDASHSTDDLIARAEWQRHLVDAVLALPEPHRTTVLLRFFEERKPGWIARAMDVPVETVRSRVRRGLTLLRERLTREHGTWRPALLTLGLGASRTGSFVGTFASLLVMNTAWKVATLVILVVGAVCLWPSDPSEVHQPSAQATTDAPATTSIAGSTSEAAGRVERTATDSLEPLTSTISLTGRMLEGGHPLAHHLIALRAEVSENVRIPGGFRRTPRTVWERSVTSDERGRFLIEAPTGPRSDSILRVVVAGYLSIGRSFDSTDAQGVIDLGDFDLEPSATLRVRVLDDDQRTLPCGFELGVRLGSLHRPQKHVTERRHATGTLEPWLEVPGLPLGSAQVTVTFPILVWTDTRTVNLERSSPNDVTFHFTGEDPWNSLSVEIAEERQVGLILPLLEEHLHLVDPSNRESPGRVLTSGPRSFDETMRVRFTTEGRGPYTLRIAHPDFHEVVLPNLTPGPGIHRVSLRGRASVHITVVDGNTCGPTPTYSLGWQRFASVQANPYRELVTPSAWQEGHLELGGLRSGDYVFVILVDGRIRARCDIDQLRPDEERHVIVDLAGTGVIRGRVTEKDAERPIPHALVVLFHPARVDDSERSPYCTRHRFVDNDRSRMEYHRTTTDSEGRFTFLDVPAGTWHVLARRATKPDVLFFEASPTGKVESLWLMPGHELDVQVPLGPPAEVAGQVLTPEGYGFVDFKLGFHSTSNEIPGDRQVDLARDGSFRVSNLAPGTYLVSLMRMGPSIVPTSLGKVSLAPGLNEPLMLDPGEELPGFLRWELDALGFAPEGSQLRLMSRNRAQVAVTLDERGRARSLQIHPGNWSAILATDTWSIEVDRDILVTPGGTTERRVSLTVESATVQFLKDDHTTPWAHRSFTLWPTTPTSRPLITVQTDEHGVVSLSIPIGEYHVRHTTAPASEGVPLRFPSQSLLVVPDR